LLLTSCTAGEAPPELALINGSIITVGGTIARAEAFLVRDRHFAAVGSNAEILSLTGDETEVLDLEGKTVTPGFIDAHLHPIPIFPGTSRVSYVELGPELVGTIDELIETLSRKAESTSAGEWVFGFGYQDTKLGGHPTRADLDRVSIEHPIMILHSSGHIRVFNSRVLVQADITPDTPDPPGGSFDRDDMNVPNGVCREAAVDLVLERGQRAASNRGGQGLPR